VRASYAAAEQNAQSIKDDQEYAKLSLIAQLTKAVWTARVLRQQTDLAHENLQSQQQILEHVKHRLQVGAASENEVLQADMSVSQAQEVFLNLKNALDQSLRSIDILVGRYPIATPLKAKDLPHVPASLATGIPSDLLERRPDVRAAAARVDAARYNIKEAEATRLPKISLTAGFGRASSDLFVLQTNAANPSTGVGVTLPLFAGGALEERVQLKKSELEQAFASYAKVGLNALKEVESALSAEQMWQIRSKQSSQVFQHQQQVMRNTEAEFKIGRIDQRQVLQQKVRTNNAQSNDWQGRLELLMQRVNLYLSLGGSAI
jgi:outer membrane protein TolC